MNQQSPDFAPNSGANFASATRGLRHVFVKRLALEASIGIHPHEKTDSQTIWVSIDAGVLEDTSDTPEHIEQVVCYEDMCKTASQLVAQGHIDLVETLAEMLADELMQDRRIMELRVQIEKPDAIQEAASVGIAISRLRG